MSGPSAFDQLRQQLVSTQELITHLQHELSELNSVVLEQQSTIDELKREVTRLEGTIEQSLQNDNFPSLEEDRPPHY